MAEAGHGSTAEAPSANEGARGLVLRPADGERAIALERLAQAAVAHALRVRRLPPGIEREDVLQLARIAGWQASQRFDARRGATWVTWVYRRMLDAVCSVWHTPAFGTATRSGYCLPLVPGGCSRAELMPDLQDGFAAADARLLLERVAVRVKPSQWAALVATVGQGLTIQDYARQVGISDTWAWKLRADALRVAREAVAL